MKTLVEFKGDFLYKANYGDKSSQMAKEKFSLNFFESLYHPLYFKQFLCKREFCERSTACPYFHNEKEKAEFELIFE